MEYPNPNRPHLNIQRLPVIIKNLLNWRSLLFGQFWISHDKNNIITISLILIKETPLSVNLNK
jgi:hypothetical protein